MTNHEGIIPYPVNKWLYIPQSKTSSLCTHYSSWRHHFIRTTLSFVRVIPAVIFAVTPIAIADTMSVSTRDQVVGAISNYIVIYNSNRTVRTSHEWPEHQIFNSNISRTKRISNESIYDTHDIADQLRPRNPRNHCCHHKFS